MKKGLVFLLALPILIASCKKADTECTMTQSSAVATSGEITYIQNYLTANTLTATQHSSGLFYSISTAGTGQIPNLCATVSVKYTGRLFNGTIFDSNTTGTSFTLGQLIVAWQKGLPLIGNGGVIRLYVPPSLGYGASAVGSIPANSYLIFDIQIIGIN